MLVGHENGSLCFSIVLEAPIPVVGPFFLLAVCKNRTGLTGAKQENLFGEDALRTPRSRLKRRFLIARSTFRRASFHGGRVGDVARVASRFLSSTQALRYE